MTKNALVSIIIPAYNAQDFVREAIDSALAQTYSNIEIIVIDDGSTDRTKEIVQSYRDPRLSYVHQSNTGLAGARNCGIREAKGEYFAFLDSDDVFLAEKVAEQVAALEMHPEAGVCYSNLLHFSDLKSGRQFFHHRYVYPSGDVFGPLLHKQFINPLTVMVRREVIQKYGMFKEGMRRSEDWELWLRWAHTGVKFFYLDKILAHYRIQNTSNLSGMQSEPQMKELNYELFAELGRKLTPAEWQKYNFGQILNKLKIKTAFAYLMVGDKIAALKIAPGIWRWLIKLLPTRVWQYLLSRGRTLKHRLLLKKERA